MHRTSLKVLCCLALLILAGCGDGRRAIDGTVTFDGQPLAKGTIEFERTEGGLVREGDIVQNGRFKVTLPDGKYKIKVNAQKAVGKIKETNMGQTNEVDVFEELIPDRYNNKTELTLEVNPGTTECKLTLVGKKSNQ